MMHSSSSDNCSNNGPLNGMSSSDILLRCRVSMTLAMEDGSCHDLTNLSLSANKPPLKDLYPNKQHVRRLPEISDHYTMKLWEPLPRADPPFHRSNTVNIPVKAEERITPKRRSRRCTVTTTTPSPSPCVPLPTPSPPLPTSTPVTIPVVRPSTEPGPRPKVNYKKLYNTQDEEDADIKEREKRNRHMSFQEQQLQRTLQEEERLQEEETPREESFSRTKGLVADAPSASPLPPRHSEERRQEPQPSLRSRMTPPAQPLPAQPEKKHTPSPRPPSPSPTGTSQTVMEIAPNMFVPYKGSAETWDAVQRGHFTVTTCFACTLQLVVIDTAEFLVCPDCHTVSPLSYGSEACRAERCGVGLGIKREWCDTEAALPSGGYTPSPSAPSFSAAPSFSTQPFPTTSPTDASAYEQRQQRRHEKTAKYNDHSSRSPTPEQDMRATYRL